MEVLNLRIMANPWNWVIVTMIVFISALAFYTVKTALQPPAVNAAGESLAA